MFRASMIPSSGEKLLYLCDTGICHSVWVASGLLVGFQSNQQRREINKYIKQNCAPSWIYLRGCYRVFIIEPYKLNQTNKCTVLTERAPNSLYQPFQKGAPKGSVDTLL